MHVTRFLLVVALFLFFPARADESPAAAAPAQADIKKNQEQTSCCAGEEKVKCPRANAAASSKKPRTKTAPASAARTAKPEVAGAANMVVTRDPETGKLRAATPAEREKLLGRRPLAQDRDLEIVTLPDGGILVKTRPEDADYAVATRSPDGSLSYSCVHREEAARQPTSPAPSPKREER